MKDLIIGERYKKKLEIPLGLHGFSAFWLPENPDVDSRLASHADLSLFLHGNTAILASYLKNNAIVNFLTIRGFKVIFSETRQSSLYPRDISLCAVLAGDRIIHNTNYTDAAINSHFEFRKIHVKQGYSRCTVLTVNNNSIITADKGIAEAAKKSGLDVLSTCSDGIVLDGFDEGFIGGACFVAEDTVYFIGELETHPDSRLIKEFIAERGKIYVNLLKGPLTDIGGAIYIK